jgi:Tfp pilus assembly protein FimT
MTGDALVVLAVLAVFVGLAYLPDVITWWRRRRGRR